MKKKVGLFGTAGQTPGSKTQNKSLFKKFKVSSSHSTSVDRNCSSNGQNATSEGSSVDVSSASQISQSAERQAILDDRHRRRFFNHYDIGSLCANLNFATKLKNQERRNTQTGASAASAALRGIEDTKNEDVDHGDQVSNDLVLR